MRSLIIHNPMSGFGSDAIFEFERALVHAGDTCTLHEIAADETPEMLAHDAEGYDVVTISGGDGTVAGLLYALRYRDVPTCIFPSGTANLFFANIGNAMEPAALARACRIGHTAQTDIDGEVHECDGITCMVANNAMMQGDIEIVPDCTMTDGMLDVIVLAVNDAVQVLRPIFAGLLDRKGKSIGRPSIVTFRGKEISIESSEPMRIEVDGEVTEDEVGSYEATVWPKANRLIVDGMSRYHADSDDGPRFSGTDEIAFPA